MKFLITFSAILVTLCSARPHLQPIDCVYPQTIVQNGAATVLTAPGQLVAAAPTPIVQSALRAPVTAVVSASDYPYLTVAHDQYHAQDALGQYKFGYNAPLSSRHEVHGLDGVSHGTYSYYDSNGVLQTVNYNAGPDGFHVAATNLPKAPEAEAVQPPAVELSPVTETPEVVNARAEHLAAHERFNAGIYPDLPKAPETPELKPVEDEPSVAALKAEHLEIVKKLSAGEVAAPEPVNLPEPEPVTDEPVVELAKQQHLAIHKAVADYDNFQKSVVTAIGPYGNTVAVAPYSAVQPTPVMHYSFGYQPQQVFVHENQPVVQHLEPNQLAPIRPATPTMSEAKPIETEPVVVSYAVAPPTPVFQYSFGYQPQQVVAYENQPAVQQLPSVQSVSPNPPAPEMPAAPTMSETKPLETEPAAVATKSEPSELENEINHGEETLPNVPDVPAMPETAVQNEAASPISAAPEQKFAEPSQPIVTEPVQTLSVEPQTLLPPSGQVVVAAPTPVTAYVSPSGYPYITPILNQYHAQDTLGQYKFGYQAPLSSRHEIHGLDGVSHGTYSYYDSNGVLQTVNYNAGPDGFHVAATNLPKAPEAEAVQAPTVELSSVTETPEVANARAEHLAAHERFNAGIYPDLPKAPETPDLKPVEDEPAVAAAKAEHLELVKKISEGEVVGPAVPESVNLPQPEAVTDEPVVTLAKQQHLAIHKAMTDYDNYQKSIITSVGPYGHPVQYSVVQSTPIVQHTVGEHQPQQIVSQEIKSVPQQVHLSQTYLSHPLQYSTGPAYVLKTPC